MKFHECFRVKANLAHIPVSDFDGDKFIGRMAMYVPQTDSYDGLRIGGKTARMGDLMLIRLWDQPYKKENKGHFKVGPIWAANPKDFRDSVPCDNVYIVPSTKEELVVEYNSSVEACEMLDSRIAWMETLGKEEFSENEYRLDEIMEELNVDVTGDNGIKVRELLKSNIKF